MQNLLVPAIPSSRCRGTDSSIVLFPHLLLITEDAETSVTRGLEGSGTGNCERNTAYFSPWFEQSLLLFLVCIDYTSLPIRFAPPVLLEHPDDKNSWLTLVDNDLKKESVGVCLPYFFCLIKISPPSQSHAISFLFFQNSELEVLHAFISKHGPLTMSHQMSLFPELAGVRGSLSLPGSAGHQDLSMDAEHLQGWSSGQPARYPSIRTGKGCLCVQT